MTDADIENLIQKFATPGHVRRHCEAVARFAVKLGEKMRAAGEKIDIELLRQSALLHDLVRVIDFREFHPEKFPQKASQEEIALWQQLRTRYKGRHHADVGAEILEAAGWPDHARLVKKHRYLQIKEGFTSWEEKLLYYADKRTKHDTTVSLQERLRDGRSRNAPETNDSEESRQLDVKILELEKEIFAITGPM